MSRFLTLLTFLISAIASAQLVNDGSTIVMGGGAKLYSSAYVQQNHTSDTATIILYSSTDSLVTNGAFINSGVISSQGVVKVVGDYSNLSTAITAYYGNNGSLLLGGSFSNAASYFIDGDGGLVRFENGAPVTMDPDTASLFNRIEVAGGNEVKLINGLTTDTLDLISGVLNTDTTTIAVLEHIPNFSSASYVQGMLLRVMKTGDYDFPLGVGAKFRPVVAEGVTDSTWMAMTVGENYSGTFEESGLLRDVAEGVFWSFVADSVTYQNTPVTFGVNYAGADLGAMSGTLVLARAEPGPEEFVSFGGVTGVSSYAGMTLLTSVDSMPFDGIIAIAETCEGSAPRADILAILEGPFNTGSGQMNAFPVATLEAQYLDGGLATDQMQPGKSVPVNAVDVLDVYLRESAAPYNYVDTAKAWLLTDGSVRDFETGAKNYLEFCDASNGVDYYIEVDHRNHLPLMSASTNSLNNAWSTSYDLTSANGANVWGTGYKSVTDLIGPTTYSAMIAGDSNGHTLEVINAGDYAWVLFGIDNLFTGYIESDVNLDGVVGANDNDVVQPNSVNLLKSSNP